MARYKVLLELTFLNIIYLSADNDCDAAAKAALIQCGDDGFRFKNINLVKVDTVVVENVDDSEKTTSAVANAGDE